MKMHMIQRKQNVIDVVRPSKISRQYAKCRTSEFRNGFIVIKSKLVVDADCECIQDKT